MEAAPPFPNPKCNVEGCPRQGKTMVRSGRRVMFAKGTERRAEVAVYTFACETRTNPCRFFHNTYIGPHGESLERLARGHFRFTDATTGQLVEIVTGLIGDKRPFPNPKCSVEGCPRDGENLWRSGQSAMAVKGTGGEQRVMVYQFHCIVRKPYKELHEEYFGPHGEPAKRIARGQFSFLDRTTGLIVETESSQVRAMREPAYRIQRSKITKKMWKDKRETMLAAIRSANADPVRRAKVSAASRQRWANPAERQRNSEMMRARWAGLTPAQHKRQVRRQTRGLNTPEAIQRKSVSLKRSWARKKERYTEALKALEMVHSGFASQLSSDASRLPSDWKKKPETWWLIGMMLLREDGISNEDLASHLEELGYPCKHGERTANGERQTIPWPDFVPLDAGFQFMRRIRKWVKRPGHQKAVN